jgi:hypothetical protein
VKLFDVNHTVLIVVGSGIPQEVNDRPLAYRLKEAIDERGDPAEWKNAVVVTDLWYESDAIAQGCPTISVGGMGANSVSARFCRVLPVALSAEKRSFIQLDITFRDSRVLLWGTTVQAAAEAVDLFIKKGYLEKLLKQIWRL